MRVGVWNDALQLTVKPVYDIKVQTQENNNLFCKIGNKEKEKRRRRIKKKKRGFQGNRRSRLRIFLNFAI